MYIFLAFHASRGKNGMIGSLCCPPVSLSRLFIALRYQSDINIKYSSQVLSWSTKKIKLLFSISILTLVPTSPGSLCLSCYVGDTAWNYYFIRRHFRQKKAEERFMQIFFAEERFMQKVFKNENFKKEPNLIILIYLHRAHF